jgi:hypothetical protein
MARQPPTVVDRTHGVMRSGQTGVPLESAADALWRALLDTSADAHHEYGGRGQRVTAQ